MKVRRVIKINCNIHTIRNSQYVYLRVKPALSYLEYSKLYNITPFNFSFSCISNKQIAYSYVFIENL